MSSFLFYILKQLRNKLSNSALPGIFLGYDNNPSAFRIYDITNNKIVISHSVVFFEDSPGNCNSPSSFLDFISLTPYCENGEMILIMKLVFIIIFMRIIIIIMKLTKVQS